MPCVGREQQRDDRRDRRLEDHRPGDVAHRQRVLALADPDDGVELLRQLGGDRGDDEGEERLVQAERRREVLDGADEEVRADDDQAERREDLDVDDPQARRGGGILDVARVEVAESERREVLDVDARVGLEMALHVPDVDPDEDCGDDPFRPGRLERQERRPDRDGIGDREVAHVVGEDAGIDRHHVASRPPPGDDEHGDARDEHRQGREHERRPENRSDADAVRRLRAAAGQDRDDRDHRLRQRRADGREDRPDCPFGELELPPEPLDAVREQLGADEDHDERADEDEDVHRSGLDALGQDDAEGDDREDERRDQRHRPLSAPDETDERCDHAGRRCGDDGDEAEPEEAGRSEVEDVVDDELRLERRPAREWRDPPREHDDDPDGEQGDRGVRSVRQQSGDRVIEVGGRAALGVSGQARARWSICQEV